MGTYLTKYGWVAALPYIFLTRSYILHVNGPAADQEYSRCSDEWDDLQHPADTATKNPEPVCQPGIAAGV